MTSFSASLTTALTVIASQLGDSQVVNVFTELWLYLKHNKDQLDMANAKHVQLEAELNQVNSKLNAVSQSLAMALARPALSNPLGGAQAPKLLKIFADPGMYDGSRGKKFEEWWTCVCMWQDENSTALAGAASICTVLSRMVGGDTGMFTRTWLNEMIRGKKDCPCWGKGGCQARSAKTEEGTTSWDEAKSTENKKEDKGKGHDWSKSIQGMSLDKARAWFKDYENLAAKLGKA